MNQKHLYTSDQKIKWFGYGEWVEEPDGVTFEHLNIKCLILRIIARESNGADIFGGYLCGYCMVPRDHTFFGKPYEELNIRVHYGLSKCDFQEGEDGEQDFWIGFDCAHSGDIIPSFKKIREKYDKLIESELKINEMIKKFNINSMLLQKSYKNINFCIQECKSMAEQIVNYNKIEK